MSDNDRAVSEPVDMGEENEFEKLKREISYSLNQIEDKIDVVLQNQSRQEAIIKHIMNALPDAPDRPILFSELSYDHMTNTLWADERYYIEFDGKQAELVSRLFMKNGKPQKKHTPIDTLVEESFDYATGQKTSRKTFYLRAKEVEKKINQLYRTPKLFNVTTDEIYFNQKN